jgi:hypothetical protein
LELSAQPVDERDRTSPWLTVTAVALPAIRKVLGSSPYRAYAGSYTGGLNGVYWIRVVEARPDGLLVIENLYDEGRTKVKQVRTLVEPDFVYPLLRGRDVGRWSARPSAHILLVQDPKKRIGYPEEYMISAAPNTYKYLQKFEEELLNKRKSGVIRDLMKKGPFYSMYAVSDYTLSQHKVVWREQATDFTVAVSSTDAAPVIPDHKLMMVPCESNQEAYYLSALLNSTIVRLAVRSYVVEVSTSTHVLEVTRIPKYDPSNEGHLALADLSRSIHDEVEKKRKILQKPKISSLEDEIDVRAAELWQISDCELDEIRRCDAAMNGSTEAGDAIEVGRLEAEVQRL